MTAYKVLTLLWEQGYKVTLTDDGGVKVSPSSTLHSNLRELLRANKAEIVTLLSDSQARTVALITVAMKVCDHYGDNHANREQMRKDCMDTPHHLRNDLIQYFNETYPQKTLIERTKP